MASTLPPLFRRITLKSSVVRTLMEIKGIGNAKAVQTMCQMGLHPHTQFTDLSRNDLENMEAYISRNFLLNEELQRKMEADVDKFIEIGCYRGSRHLMGLPANGQRTRSNAISCRNNRFRKNRADHNQTYTKRMQAKLQG
eukprot:21699_1